MLCNALLPDCRHAIGDNKFDITIHTLGLYWPEFERDIRFSNFHKFLYTYKVTS